MISSLEFMQRLAVLVPQPRLPTATRAADVAVAAEGRVAAAERRKAERDYWRSLALVVAQKQIVLDLANSMVQCNAWRAQQAGGFGGSRQKLVETDIKNSLEMLEKLHAEAKPLLLERLEAVTKSSDGVLATAHITLDGLHVFHETLKEKLLKDLAQCREEIRSFKAT